MNQVVNTSRTFPLIDTSLSGLIYKAKAYRPIGGIIVFLPLSCTKCRIEINRIVFGCIYCYFVSGEYLQGHNHRRMAHRNDQVDISSFREENACGMCILYESKSHSANTVSPEESFPLILMESFTSARLSRRFLPPPPSGRKSIPRWNPHLHTQSDRSVILYLNSQRRHKPHFDGWAISAKRLPFRGM